jgi:hypothetical protein
MVAFLGVWRSSFSRRFEVQDKEEGRRERQQPILHCCKKKRLEPWNPSPYYSAHEHFSLQVKFTLLIPAARHCSPHGALLLL